MRCEYDFKIFLLFSMKCPFLFRVFALLFDQLVGLGVVEEGHA